MKLVIKNGTIIDPKHQRNQTGDIWIENGKIKEITECGKSLSDQSVQSIDAVGMVVAPGLIDMHVHFREPGYEYKETIASGTQAAAAGGITSVACMPNTNPPIDNLAMVELILSKAKTQGVVNVYPMACITKGRAGKELSGMGELKAAGVVAVSDDGDPVESPALMRSAMQYANMLDLLIINHAEEKSLAGKGVAHAGFMSAKLGLPGVPRSAMDIMIARDILLAEETGSRIHIPHVSTQGAVRMIREAKARGVRVTAETAPHYLVLTDSCLETYDTNLRVNPPIPESADRDALIAGLQDGTIDVIATDHAPHSRREKEMEFDQAAPGICGLETCLSLAITALVESGKMSLPELLSTLTQKPAEILALPKGSIAPGDDADIVIFDPKKNRKIDANSFKSQSDNTPFNGWEVKGDVAMTLVAGEEVYRNSWFK